MTEKPFENLRGVARAQAVVAAMLADDGCAWHREQTHASLTRYLVEESAETVDAIDRDLPDAQVAEELGDVLYQVLFHTALAERDGEGYDFESVAENLANKLIARHPHVFGQVGHMSAAELEKEWENLKQAAASGSEFRGSGGEKTAPRGVLEGVPATLPSLARAAKFAQRIARFPEHGSMAELWREITAESTAEPVAKTATAPGKSVIPGETTENSVQNQAENEIATRLIETISNAEDKGIDADAALRRTLVQIEKRLTRA
ncbi:MAG: MazG nucleotide pyrophosphohydrolase domain-containing protein [Microbacteriaceae bacterium]|nr:MazG nucleotide pyrophosphohydrolase domain-containing protein [Microbacteriaceae bacterium]